MEKPKNTRYFIGIEGRKIKPTQKHRAAIWENMVGTVYAMNDKYQIKYFDYNYDEAIEFTGLKNKKDIRIYRTNKRLTYSQSHPSGPREKQMVLWVEEGEE